jgi:general secretion pathway protein G
MKFINDRRELRSQSGFTLIELLVVIAILGILAGVVVFAVGGITDNGQEAACKIEKRTIQTALQAFRAQEGAYPVDENDQGPDAAGEAFVPGFLESVPTYYTITYATHSTAPVAGGKCVGF